MRLLAGFIFIMVSMATSHAESVGPGTTQSMFTSEAGTSSSYYDSTTLASVDPLGGLAKLSGDFGEALEHGGGLNGCGCHFNRKTGECHCHRSYGCGCTCEPPACAKK